MGWLIIIGSLLGGVLVLGLALALVKGGNDNTVECPECGGRADNVGGASSKSGNPTYLSDCRECHKTFEYEEVYNSDRL